MEKTAAIKNETLCVLDFGKTIAGYKQLTKELNQFVQVYELVMDAPFDSEAYELVKSRNLEAMRTVFVQRLEKDLKTIARRFQDEFRKKGMQDFVPLEKSFRNVITQKDQLERPGTGENVVLFWEEIRLVKGKFMFDDTDAKRIVSKYFEVRTDSEHNRKLADQINEFQKAWDNLVQTLYGERPKMGHTPAGTWFNNLNPQENHLFHGIVEIGENGQLLKHWENHFAPKDEYIPD